MDLLWALWGQLRLWRGPAFRCTCPHISGSVVGIFSVNSDGSVYEANHRHLICSLCSCTERFSLFFLSHLPLGHSCGFSPISVCGPPTVVCSWGCPRALRSAPVRTGHEVGMALGPQELWWLQVWRGGWQLWDIQSCQWGGVLVRQQPWAWEIRP